MMNKIGIGVLTCNREELFKQCIASIPEVGIIVVINDGMPYSDQVYPSKVDELVQHPQNRGIGPSKNEALRILLSSGCNHIFLCEDDIALRDSEVCESYIKASQCTGIYHFNFAYHGPANKTKDGLPNPKKIVAFNCGVKLAFCRHPIGAFSYFRDEVLTKVGFIDERFKNFHEHVDHTNKIIRGGFHPPFGWFADLADSYDRIIDLDPDLSKSTLRQNLTQYKLQYYLYVIYYRLKNNEIRRTPIANEDEFMESLKSLLARFGTMSAHMI